MALMVCRRCTARFAVGLRLCPQCTAEDAYLEGTEDMPKTTVHTGGTIEGTDGVTRQVNDDGTLGTPLEEIEQLPDGEFATDDGVQHISEGTGEPMTGVQHPADGTPAEISNEPAKPAKKAPAKKAAPRKSNAAKSA